MEIGVAFGVQTLLILQTRTMYFTVSQKLLGRALVCGIVMHVIIQGIFADIDNAFIVSDDIYGYFLIDLEMEIIQLI